jgi:hypothetical protein
MEAIMARAEKVAATTGGLRPAPLLSVRSVARWLGKGRRWVLVMVRRSHRDGGPWRVVRLGRDWRVDEESVQRWLDRQGAARGGGA